MMCAHCEARVKKALEELRGVEEARPDHEKGIVTLALSTSPDEEQLRKAIENAGYKFKGYAK